MLTNKLLRIFIIIIVTLCIIIGVACISLFYYEPTLKNGFTFSSAGTTIQLSDGRKLAYLDSGDPKGRPLFYFHGGPGSRLEGLIYDKVNRQLGIRMISLDRPGYGLSDFQENRTYLHWAKDISELADHLGIDRFGVLGWSSGGPYASVVAHEIPQQVTVAAIVAGEINYASNDIPESVLTGNTISGSSINKVFIWSANNCPLLMRTLFRTMRLILLSDPAGMVENSGGADLLTKDIEFFSIKDYIASSVESFRQGAKGVTHDFTIERLKLPFKLKDIKGPTVLVFHGKEDMAVDPKISEYVCERIPTCHKPKIYPNEGHSVVYYRYKEIIQAMLKFWNPRPGVAD